MRSNKDSNPPFIYIIIRVPSLANVVVWTAIGGLVVSFLKLL